MQSSKRQILAALKRQGGCTVDGLVLIVGLAPMTVRQHLATLGRDGLVRSIEERQRLGRPHFVYSLTDQGERTFEPYFSEVAAQLFAEASRLESTEIVGLSAEQKSTLLLEKLADRFVAQHAANLCTLALTERILAVTRLLDAAGGFAECSEDERGFSISDYNCCYRKLASPLGAGCPWHERVLGALLGDRVRRDEGAGGRSQACRYLISHHTTCAAASRTPAALIASGRAGTPAATG